MTMTETTTPAQMILDRYFDFQHAFADELGAIALALQSAEPPVGASADAVSAARRAIRELNAAIEAVWPDVPDDLLLRGVQGEGRGRLSVDELKPLITPGAPGALTIDKLARRMAGESVPGPLRLNQVTLPTSNLARSIAFYRGLGLRLIVRDDSVGYARLLLPDGGPDGGSRWPADLSVPCRHQSQGSALATGRFLLTGYCIARARRHLARSNELRAGYSGASCA